MLTGAVLENSLDLTDSLTTQTRVTVCAEPLQEEPVLSHLRLIQLLLWEGHAPRLFLTTWWGPSLIFSIFTLQPAQLIFSLALAEGNPSSH